MGQLVEGKWQKGWYDPDAKGAFQRPKTVFRGTVAPADVERGRYHLYVAYACPWAHRAMIVRAMRGLEDAIAMTFVDPRMTDEGWSFGGEGEKDPLFDYPYLRDVYTRADRKYTGRVTVPVLWDKKKDTIVNNESRDVIRILDTAFDALADGPSLAPPDLVPLIDQRLDEIYDPYNNGVYRAGFAGKQEAYDEAVRDVFATLDRMDALLGNQRFLCGETMTEADVAFFTTSLRFDLVYYSHFKCNVRRIQDYKNVWRFVRELYSLPAVKRTCDLNQIKLHYYWSQTTVNPSRIVPLGPSLDL
ncbi:MAG: glutathione S-transferase family protein [Labilithrix sp.]|nr:glutathione S-transferase family protein [Labilithrix sp.]MCW5815017.1 glutathione S-transferase family protein [Labilithrix sp.]